MTDDLTAHTRRLLDATRVAAHLAAQVDDIRSTTPLGYSAGRSFDGTPRPVESTVEGLDARGVTVAVLAARRSLQRAAEITESACRSLERARDGWEGTTVS